MSEKCVFSLVYKKKPEENYGGISVAATRVEMGRELARWIPEEIGEQIDMVCPVPYTGTYYAMGLAQALQKPYMEGIIKKDRTERSFTIGDADERKKFLYGRLQAVKELVGGQKIALVDEAVFTGATLKVACELLQEASAQEVFLCIPTPMCHKACEHMEGMKKKMLLEYLPYRMLATYFGVSGIYFQEERLFKRMVSRFGSDICTRCFVED